MSAGLDIGSKTIKLVDLIKEGERWRLRASGIIGYNGKPPASLQDEQEMILLAETIKKLHKEARISTNDVIVSLPATQVFTRTIKFPLLTESEIASAVKWEAEQYIPIPVEEAIIQHQIIDKRQDTTPPQANVLLVAAPRNLVETYVKIANMAGLSPVAMETDQMASIRSLAPKDDTTLLIDFGAESTNIAISKNAQLYFSRSIPTAGDAFTRAVAQVLGIETRQAEEYKRAYGLASGQLEGKIKRALEPVFQMVADEIRKAIHYYKSENNGESPSYVIISGGTAGMPDVVSVLSNYLGLEVVIGNPFANIVIDKTVAQSLLGYSPLYAVAVGLAMRED